MSFTIDKNHPKELVAKKSITCWKVVTVMMWYHTREFDSFWQKHHYNFAGKTVLKMDTEFPSKPSTVLPDVMRIDEGYTSYSTLRQAKVFLKNRRANIVIVQMTIPKGARYYYNEWEGEYISDAIRLPNKPKYLYRCKQEKMSYNHSDSPHDLIPWSDTTWSDTYKVKPK